MYSKHAVLAQAASAHFWIESFKVTNSKLQNLQPSSLKQKFQASHFGINNPHIPKSRQLAFKCSMLRKVKGETKAGGMGNIISWTDPA